MGMLRQLVPRVIQTQNLYILNTFVVVRYQIYTATVNKKIVSAPPRLHMGMRAGGRVSHIISHYFIASLNLLKIPNCYTKIQNTVFLLEMTLIGHQLVIYIL